MKCIKYFNLLGGDKKFLDIGGGISPIHFILSRHGHVYNLDSSFDGWFPHEDKFYTEASPEFVEEQKKFNKILAEKNASRAKLSRRQKKINDFERNESYLKSVISGLEDEKIKLESKIIVLMSKTIDREMLS